MPVDNTPWWEKLRSVILPDNADVTQEMASFLQPRTPASVGRTPAVISPQDTEKLKTGLLELQKVAPKGTVASGGLTSNERSDITGLRNVVMSSPEIQDYTNAIMQIPAMQEQQAGQKQMEDMLAMEMAKEPDVAGALLPPIARYADYVSGTDLAKNIDVESPVERNKRLLTSAKMVQDARNALTGETFKAATALKAGVDTTKMLNEVKSSLGLGQPKGNVGGLSEAQMATQLARFGERLGNPLADIQAAASVLQPYMSSKAKIPGIGVGKAALPSFLLSPEGAAVQQAVRKLQLSFTYLSSGKQISEPERQELARITGSGFFSSEENLRSGVRLLMKGIKKSVEQKKATTHKQVLETALAQGMDLTVPELFATEEPGSKAGKPDLMEMMKQVQQEKKKK